eukprot:CAMPEP_0115288414 /NCGR_PEP_ID=MMETSP0270-20121206/62961_1 /TAXON_ID=71861 /ORGANISM="Scrippsiella trochoidea, Strain CCMP3099" /LENGTH=381 /DNA_ID=CAMNT_0002705521 /DNA_START=146 /DNA_END=1291 /DNA_ORIENTATION=+
MAATVPAAEAQARTKKTSKQRTLHLIKSLDPDDDERTTISKRISWILRHGAKVAGVKMDDNGWVFISDLLKAEILDDVDENMLMQVIIDSNGKKLRYELEDTPNGQRIKAYSKKERKEKESASGIVGSKPDKTLDGKSLRQDAPLFVPNQGGPAPATPSGAGASQPQYPMSPSAGMGYPWPGFGFPPMMPFMQNPWMAWQQQMSQAQPGKFQGRIKSFNSEKGFGFIECAHTYAQYNRDVFLHKAQIGDMTVGTLVTFTCEVNKQGMPQAKDIQPMGGAAAGSKGAAGGKGKGKGTGKGKEGKGKEGKGKEGKEGKGEGKGKGKGGSKKSKEGKDKEGKEKDKDKDAKEGDGESKEEKPAEAAVAEGEKTAEAGAAAEASA